MKYIRFLTAVISTTLFSTPEAAARLGETISQSDQRYGSPEANSFNWAPLLSGATNRTYKFHGWRIEVAFVNGKAAMLRYAKANNQKIQDDEVAAVLDGEAAGGSWSEDSQLTLNPHKALMNILLQSKGWKNSNGSIAYFKDPMHTQLIFEAPIAEEFRKATAEAAEKKRKSDIPNF